MDGIRKEHAELNRDQGTLEELIGTVKNKIKILKYNLSQTRYNAGQSLLISLFTGIVTDVLVMAFTV